MLDRIQQLNYKNPPEANQVSVTVAVNVQETLLRLRSDEQQEKYLYRACLNELDAVVSMNSANNTRVFQYRLIAEYLVGGSMCRVYQPDHRAKRFEVATDHTRAPS
jgi:hypothetical protein